MVAQAYHMVITIEAQNNFEPIDNEELEAILNKETIEDDLYIETKPPVPTQESEVHVVEESKPNENPETDIEPEPVVEEPVLVKEKVPVVVEEAEEVKEVELVTPPQPKAAQSSEFASELIKLIEKETNAFRRANNLDTLSREPVLEQNAKRYGETMLSGDFMSHTNKAGCDLTCRFKADGYVTNAWGENLAMIKFDDPLSAKEVADFFMTGWKKSSGHRENLLSSDFRYQGIGVAYSHNAVYVSVQFAK